MVILGTIFFMLFQYIAKLITIAILWFLSKVFKVCSLDDIMSRWTFISLMKNAMFFNEILQIFLGANLELMLASILNLRAELQDPDCTKVNKIFSISVVVIVCLFLPITIIYILCRLKTQGNNPKFV
jgi:hypothetical protein